MFSVANEEFSVVTSSSWFRCGNLCKLVLLEISRLLNTGLDMESLSICVRLCEQGINPEALSAVIKELRKASETLKVSENCTN
ncbi:mitotic-spindle organizing protein 1 isoform X1 [Poecilia latipinna]|uniref:mitotic-spindle organizing protein 1 isoform X1 n=1 Tax=Poecilia reticulata TaxID=8081 RepID=UPI0004A26052|nr:PREDICTED: mitotic-spindle organizing protein 1 isoform X1 [Poecilia reticulata]XP_014888553.1 PREDICTED: mitotic-spindle organizing protein 1 isoform X1 [Poecilia latipinna]